jgi:hypothetical protein
MRHTSEAHFTPSPRHGPRTSDRNFAKDLRRLLRIPSTESLSPIANPVERAANKTPSFGWLYRLLLVSVN